MACISAPKFANVVVLLYHSEDIDSVTMLMVLVHFQVHFHNRIPSLAERSCIE
jgi:hypothetical protein